MNQVDVPRRRVGAALARNANIGLNPAHVSIAGNRFTLVDAVGARKPVETHDKNGPYMDCIVIDALEHRSRTFWGKGKTYDPANVAPPLCFSDNGEAPSANSQEPQSPKCHSCQWSVWGSAVSFKGKAIPACQQLQKLAVLELSTNMTFLLRVPANSLKSLDAYNAKFLTQDFEIDDVVTRVSFVPGEVGKLQFEAQEMADEDAVARRGEILASDTTDILVNRYDRPFTGPVAAALPAQTPQIQEETPQAAPPAEPAPARRPPGRPRKPAGNGQQEAASKPPFPVDTPSPGAASFGVEQPSQPDEKVTKAMEGFFAKK